MTTNSEDRYNLGTNIKVVGVGGAGGNAIANMIAKGVQGVQFIAANTDAQALNRTNARTMIKLGDSGLGAGANPSVGREAALAARRAITEALDGAHMVFITAGMGGGTGTGAAPVIAEIAREMNILTVGVVTKPFDFEGKKRHNAAIEGIDELNKHVDSLIIVLNDKLLEVLGDDVTQVEAFKAADDVLFNATAGIAEIINKPGMINVDFQDVKTVMSERGRAMMGSGVARGDNRATEAAELAIACPLLEGADVRGARGLLVNITANEDNLKMREAREIMKVIGEHVGEEATIIYGAVYDEEMGDELRVTVIATGVNDRERASTEQNAADHLDGLNFTMPAHAAAGAQAFLRKESQQEAAEKSAGGAQVWRKDGVSVPRSGTQSASVVERIEQSNFEIPSFLRRNKTR